MRMLKIFTRIRNYILIKRYPFLECRNVWTNSKLDNRYEFTWLDDLPKGWRKRFGKDICKELKQLFKKSKANNYINGYRICQIKEKYGQLRWYDNGVPEDIYKEYNKIIDKYTELSEHTCIVCGKPGDIDLDRYWLEPLCSKHKKLK